MSVWIRFIKPKFRKKGRSGKQEIASCSYFNGVVIKVVLPGISMNIETRNRLLKESEKVIKEIVQKEINHSYQSLREKS